MSKRGRGHELPKYRTGCCYGKTVQDAGTTWPNRDAVAGGTGWRPGAAKRAKPLPVCVRPVVSGYFYHPNSKLGEKSICHLRFTVGRTAEVASTTQLFEQLFNQWFVEMDGSCVVIEPALRTVQAPTLIVWGTDDIFFDVKWAYWLRDTIPGTREVAILEGARLFFPEERPAELANHLRRHWARVDSELVNK